MLREDISDEFADSKIDASKWFVQGVGGDYYIWNGRSPSQYAEHNVNQENGLLKLEVRWEPDFPFTDEIHAPVFGEPLPYENITTPCFIGRRPFQCGYVEIKSKAADAEITSAFWSMGRNIEFDFFEQFGGGRAKGKRHLNSELWWSIRDWNQLKGKPAYTQRKDLGFCVADDFHVYGVEWDESGVKYYVDGELFSRVTVAEVRAWARENREVEEDYDGWVATVPIYLWLDMETFPWHGIPDSKEDLEFNSPESEKHDGVVDFEIDYVRVWQQPGANNSPADSLSADFFGFEGPILIAGNELLWWIPNDSRELFSIVEERSAQGSKSLKFSSIGQMPNRAVAFAPYGSLGLDASEYKFSMRVWVEPGCSVERLRVILEDPWRELKPFDLTGLDSGKWVTLTQSCRRAKASGTKDRVRIVIQPDDVSVSGESSPLFIDEISFEKIL